MEWDVNYHQHLAVSYETLAPLLFTTRSSVQHPRAGPGAVVGGAAAEDDSTAAAQVNVALIVRGGKGFAPSPTIDTPEPVNALLIAATATRPSVIVRRLLRSAIHDASWEGRDRMEFRAQERKTRAGR
jgi:hypothetical protein